MPLYLTVATISYRCLRDPAKRLAIFVFARKFGVQVLCLQETHSQSQDESKWQNEWGDKIQAVFNSNIEISRKTDAGTAVLLNNTLLKFGDFWFIYMKNLSILVKVWKNMGPNCRNTTI